MSDRYLRQMRIINEIIRRNPAPAHVVVIERDWLTGFIQGDGSVWTSFGKSQSCKFGFQMMHFFGIAQHARSLYILDMIYKLMGQHGSFKQDKKNVWELRIANSMNLKQEVLQAFNPSQLRGPKYANFQIFHQACILQKQLPTKKENYWRLIFNVTYNPSKKRQYTFENLKNIAQQKVGKENLEFVKSIQRNEIINRNQQKLTEMFVTGFTDAEGCFCINLSTRTKQWPLISCELRYEIGAHKNCSDILREINDQFFKNQGTLTIQKTYFKLVFRRLSLILNMIIPFYSRYRLKSSKYYDFEKFVEVAELMKEKKHLTYQGIQRIIDLAFSSNSGKEGQSLRAHNKQQYLEYLALAPTRLEFLRVQPNLKDMKDKIMISRHKKNINNDNNITTPKAGEDSM